MDVVDLTLSDDDSPQLGLAARLAGRATAAAAAALPRAASSPGARRTALSPLHNTHRHASPGEGAASPKSARDAAAAAAERRWGMLKGGASEDTEPAAASQQAAGGRRKSLQALLAVEDAVAAGGSYQAGQLASMDFEELLAPPAAGNAAGAAGRAVRRQRRQGGAALAGLRDTFADDWDGTILPSSQELAASQQQRQQQQQQQPHSRAGSGNLARGASGNLAAESALRHGLLGCHLGSGGLPAAPAAGAAAAGGSQPFAEQAQQPQRAQQQQEEDYWQLGNTLADDGDPEWQPGSSQGGRGGRDDGGDDYEPWGAAAEQQPKKKRRGRKTQEEKEADAAEKEARKAEKEREKKLKAAEKEREKAAKQLERKYNSKSGHLKWITVLLDPRLVNCGLGLKIAERLQETQSGDKGEDAVAKDVRDCGLAPYRAIKWLRKVPAQQQQQQQQQAGFEVAGEGAELEGALVDEEMPYVMVCMEAEEFVNEVLRDRLDALLSLLEACCPGYCASLLVCGLAAYLQKREREEGRRALQARTGELGFVRAPVDDFVAGLAIECPGLGFRDVVDAPQGGEHVLSMTVAIAKEPYKPSEAQHWLQCHGGGKDSQPMKSMLASNPLADSATETFAHALYGMPVHALNPGVAHAVASRYRSLGALMAMLLDPSRPDAAKIKEIEDMKRTSSTAGARGMRVGPKAAERLLQLLTSADPSLPINPTD